MQINNYQKKILLEILYNRVKDEQHIINKLKQTIVHNENWAMPIAKNMENHRIVKGMNEVIRDAKKDIESNEKDLEQIQDLINKIKDLVVN